MNLNVKMPASLLIIAVLIIIIGILALRLISLAQRLRAMAAEKEELKRQLLFHRKANEGKTEFLSRMSHEIRTPVNAVIGMADLAEKACAQEKDIGKIGGYLNRINVSCRYLTVLLSDILDMTRIESGMVDIARERFGLDDIIHRLRVFMEPQVEEKRIEFNIEDNAVHRVYRGDELRINQVLINLLGNAVKFTNANGKISLKLQETDAGEGVSKLLFSVWDTGIGIAGKDQERIFEMFEQAAPNLNNRFGGTGMGLSISRKLANLMNGRLYMESELAKGSVFYFELELPWAEECDPPAQECPDVSYDFSGKRVLLAEDDELNAFVISELLKNAGFEVETARNGQEAVDKYGRAPNYYYAVILMDIQMPHKNGLEASREIRALRRETMGEIPIIAMSADVFRDGQGAAMEAGMNAFISKPFNAKEAFGVISRQIKESGY